MKFKYIFIIFIVFILVGCDEFINQFSKQEETIHTLNVGEITSDSFVVDITINDPEKRILGEFMSLCVVGDNTDLESELTVSNHKVTITGLSPNTIYSVILTSKYSDGLVVTNDYVLDSDLVTTLESMTQEVVEINIENNYLEDNVYYFDLVVSNENLIKDFEFTIKLKDLNSLDEINIITDSLNDIIIDGLMIDSKYQIDIDYSYTIVSSNEDVSGSISKKVDTIFGLPFEYVDLSLKINDVQDYYNLIYSNLLTGNNQFSVVCDEGVMCDEILNLGDDNIFSIFNFISPYENYGSLGYTYTSSMIELSFTEPKYTEEQKNSINEIIPTIIDSIIDEDMDEYDKITAVHDYIINNSVYDSICLEDDTKCENAYNAYGIFFENTAVCEGYSEAVQLLLNEIGIEAYRITSDLHEWNVVYYNEEYLHLDATWDDPVTNDGSSVLSNTYFLISTEELKLLDDTNSHEFNQEIYDFIN